jgi:hypothetical protein
VGLRPHSPPLKVQRRGALGIKPLEAEGGVVSKKVASPPLNIRVAHRILFEFTNHLVCAAEEGIFLLRRSHPSLELGKEGNGLASTAF